MSKLNEPEFSAWLANRVQGDEQLCLEIDAVVAKQIDLTEVIKLVVARAVAQLQEDGFCSFGWHRNEIDDLTPDGRCMYCEEPAAAHETILVCKQKASTIDEGDG